MAHRYWRLYWNASLSSAYLWGSTGRFAGMNEVELRASQGGADETGSGTASASSTDGGTSPSYAVDDSSSTHWRTSYGTPLPAWWKYDFGSGNDKDIVEIALTTINASNWGEAAAPFDFELQYSDNDSDWYTAGHWTYVVGWTYNETRIFQTALDDLAATQVMKLAVAGGVPDLVATQIQKVVVAAEEPDLVVTQIMKVVVAELPVPSKPVLITPYQDYLASEILPIYYEPSTDPLNGEIWYAARMKLSTDTVWTDIFTARSESTIYNHDIAGAADGTYDFEMWAYTAAYTSQKNVLTFEIHDGIPTAPFITTPYDGQALRQTTVTVEWEAATDPDDDPLTYSARWKKTSDSSWTSLFTGESGLSYGWNLSAFAVDSYELEIWADDGVGPGPSDHVYFTIFIADQPDAPRTKAYDITTDSVSQGLENYTHPFDRPWQATQYQLMPWDGDWSNPVGDVTVTDATYEFHYTWTDLPPGFRGVMRARYQDNNNSWGDWTAEVYFAIQATETDWEKLWERDVQWIAGGLGVQWRASTTFTGGFFASAPTSALVDPNAEGVGSFYLSGYLMAGGCYCGWIGRDTELRSMGIGVFTGDSENGGMKAVKFGMTFGMSASPVGAHGGGTSWYADVLINPSWYFWGHAGGSGTISFPAYIQVTRNVTVAYGAPIGGWVMQFTHYPFYFLEMLVQRNVSTNTTRLRGRVIYVGFFAGVPPEPIIPKTMREDQWDVDVEINDLTVCGKPGFWANAGWATSTAYTDFWGLQCVPLRDLGQTYPVAVDAPDPYEEPDPAACVPVAEDALADPVFFPAPPNGDVEEGWSHPSDLITARDQTEQRVSLRDIPVETISFTTTLLTPREVTNIKALLWDEQPSRWGVPMWMDAATLDVDLSSGSGSIPAASVDTVGRSFEDATHVALWVDQFTWDFLPATLEADGSITLTGTTSRDYSAYKTQVIPCRVGRMMDTATFPRAAPTIGDLTVTFVLEAVDG